MTNQLYTKEGELWFWRKMSVETLSLKSKVMIQNAQVVCVWLWLGDVIILWTTLPPAVSCGTHQSHCSPQQSHCSTHQSHCSTHQSHDSTHQSHCSTRQSHCNAHQCHLALLSVTSVWWSHEYYGHLESLATTYGVCLVVNRITCVYEITCFWLQRLVRLADMKWS